MRSKHVTTKANAPPIRAIATRNAAIGSLVCLDFTMLFFTGGFGRVEFGHNVVERFTVEDQ